MSAKSDEEIADIVNSYLEEGKEIEEKILEICWYMRGSISLEEAWNLPFSSIQIITRQIGERMEVVKKSGLPLL